MGNSSDAKARVYPMLDIAATALGRALDVLHELGDHDTEEALSEAWIRVSRLRDDAKPSS